LFKSDIALILFQPLFSVLSAITVERCRCQCRVV